VKTAGQIRQKLKQVVYRHRKEHVRRGLARRPENCEHNGVVHLPVHMANRETVRICRYVDDNGAWRNRVCDPALGGVQQAQACPHFSCCNTPESLKEDFGRGIGLDGTPVEIGHIAKHYPDVAALMWVLGPVAGPQAPEDDPIDDGILAFFGPSESLEDEETDE
jgi:hypothetical protein